MKEKKIKLGQFFTTKSNWLKPQVVEFIKESGLNVFYDPFAGRGDLLFQISQIFPNSLIKGLDIDENLEWEKNDSLKKIPRLENSIIITNPPYLAKHSASRKKLNLDNYFFNTKYDDIYLVALDRMLETNSITVCIIPESFINSNYSKKDYIYSITILEDNLFDDTETPICVVCFDNIIKDFSKIKIYKNDIYIGSLKDIQDIKLKPKKIIKINFNDLTGWLGLRAVDSSNDIDNIKFDFKENIRYEWDNKIKSSSRHFSLINIDIPEKDKGEFIRRSNEILNNIRLKSNDIVLTPFKGNTKKGRRRRRLDFILARAIMEQAYLGINKEI